MLSTTQTRPLLLLLICCCLLLVAAGCSSKEETTDQQRRRNNQTIELLSRTSDSHLFHIETPTLRDPPQYPWTEASSCLHPRITKEFFRCKGCYSNPAFITKDAKGEPLRISDCIGGHIHSLPIKDGKEFIYSALIDLCNYIQTETQRKVVITCGHRCPDHNSYADKEGHSSSSKHMIGAEVDFYVEGMEEQGLAIVDIVLDYYKKHPQYRDDKNYTEFQRYTKSDTNTTTQPWFNKEVYIKYFGAKEGRDADNNHGFPYLSIQVRYDKDSGERVSYSWPKAHRGYWKG